MLLRNNLFLKIVCISLFLCKIRLSYFRENFWIERVEPGDIWIASESFVFLGFLNNVVLSSSSTFLIASSISFDGYFLLFK